ncbi:hypothetical protein ElyMa_003505100 [Elysia marginata]|uniref:Uncharacterized protein n=1 Tax=Elysia marginata TaxID=1093978 RepID=A0AAV4EFM4_9GAST|nr:hypothetical protein ElyMa_003505100 [Elysia marginata]
MISRWKRGKEKGEEKVENRNEAEITTRIISFPSHPQQNGGNGIRMMTPRKPPPRQQAPMGHHRGNNKQWQLYGSHPADSHA